MQKICYCVSKWLKIDDKKWWEGDFSNNFLKKLEKICGNSVGILDFLWIFCGNFKEDLWEFFPTKAATLLYRMPNLPHFRKNGTPFPTCPTRVSILPRRWGKTEQFFFSKNLDFLLTYHLKSSMKKSSIVREKLIHNLKFTEHELES